MTIKELAAEVADWHAEQFPGLPAAIALRKFQAEAAELSVAVAGMNWRPSKVAADALLEEAADCLISLVGILRIMSLAGGFEDAVAEKWARVRARKYAGAASATREDR